MNLKKEPENTSKHIPSIDELEGEARMKRDDERLAQQGEVQVEADVQETIVSIDQSGVREEEEAAIVQMTGADGTMARPPKNPEIRFLKRIPFTYIDPATDREKEGFKTEPAMRPVPTGAETKTGQFVTLEVNGILYVNRDKLERPEWRDGNTLAEQYVKAYSTDDKKSKTTVIRIMCDDQSTRTVTIKSFIDTNLVKCIVWGGYTFMHQGAIYHHGLTPRDKRVLGTRNEAVQMISSF
jgi:hypothetical protein